MAGFDGRIRWQLQQYGPLSVILCWEREQTASSALLLWHTSESFTTSSSSPLFCCFHRERVSVSSNVSLLTETRHSLCHTHWLLPPAPVILSCFHGLPDCAELYLEWINLHLFQVSGLNNIPCSRHNLTVFNPRSLCHQKHNGSHKTSGVRWMHILSPVRAGTVDQSPPSVHPSGGGL